MRILAVAAEAAPYAKVGGLGDVAAALPAALAALGHDVRLVLPRARGVMPHAGARVAWRDRVPWGVGSVDVCMLAERLPGARGVEVRLVDAEPLATSPVYGGADEADRYMLLASAALVDCLRPGATWTPDVIQAHDWHAAAAILQVARRRARREPLGDVRTVLTVHNMAYQGIREAAFAAQHGIAPPPQVGDLEPSEVNLLGRALALADHVTAVSPTFAWEITTPEGGFGLDGVLRARGDAVSGIVNGIDVRAFDPARDPRIASRFSARSLDRRVRNRHALGDALRLDIRRETPIVGVVSRLVEQKGLDILLAAAPALLERGARLAVLGTGDPEVERGFADLAAANPGRVAAHIGFDASLAQRIYAGCDLFAMPSRFEPCGLGQLIAMRYGAVPLVRRTGGLADTVDETTGFLFDDATPAALVAALDRALAVYDVPERWRRLQLAGMTRDSTWGASARAYADLFAAICAAPPRP